MKREIAAQPKATENMDDGCEATMTDLPHDLLALVLTFLPITDCLTTTDLVCKAFHEASKHPMCWDAEIALYNDSSVTRAVSFFTKHRINPVLAIDTSAVSESLLHTLSRLTSLRVLRLAAPNGVSTITRMLSALIHLESFGADLDLPDSDSLEFVMPSMPHLTVLFLHFNAGRTLISVDASHLPRLSELTIGCENLEHATFPQTLNKLTLFASCYSTQVLDAIAKLDNLQYLHSQVGDTILSHPNLRSTFTLTSLSFKGSLADKATENLHRFTKLTRLHVVNWESMDTAHVAAIVSSPLLTQLRVDMCSFHPNADLSSFGRASSLQHLHISGLPPDALRFFALPSLLSFTHLDCEISSSLSPLAACVNLTAFYTCITLSEQDAQVLAGLTKLEKLHAPMASEACLSHICRLPRLELLRVSAFSTEDNMVGLVASQALVGLAPTIEVLVLPRIDDTHRQAVVLAVSQLTKLSFFSTDSKLSDEEVSLLRDSLPRLCDLCHGGVCIVCFDDDVT